MTAAVRTTPTSTNGGSDNGVTYTDAVDAEIEALWAVAHNWLTNVSGTNTITATSDTSQVAAIAGYARPMAFWLVPENDNDSTVTIAIDGLSAKAIHDKDGNALSASALTAGRAHEIVYDGSAFRLMGSASSAGGGTQDNAINGGRLTISTGVPVLGAAVSAATQAFWTPDASNQISLYDGSSAWNIITSAEVGIKFTDTQTGSTHSGTKVIDGLTDTSKLMVGMKISGTGVGSGSVIATIDSATQVTGTVNSSASASVSVTFKVPADTGVDIFGKNHSSALLLQGLFRASLLTPNTMAKQDGIDVLGADHTWRWLGTIASSATDGQIDWALTGQRRYRVWNRYNRRNRHSCEAFAATGTWYKSLCTTQVTADVRAAGGGGGENGIGAGSDASSSSFGAHVSAAGGGGGGGGFTGGQGSDGTGSSGDANFSGGGGAGGQSDSTAGAAGRGGFGGRGVRTRNAADLGSTETVTVGAAGSGAGGNAGTGGSGAITVDEVLEI